MHGQFGYAWVTVKQDMNLRNYTLYGVAADYALTEPLHGVAEFVSNQHPDRTQVEQKLGLVGFTYAVNKNFILDMSYKKGLSDSSPEWGFGVGAAIQF